jgi:Beta-lactamase class C and other penicillin binding proteins
MKMRSRFAGCLLLLALAQLGAGAELPPDVRAAIDLKVAEVLRDTGAPGASLAVVKDGAIVYVKAYGDARLGPPPLATAEEMRFSIGSISKQFLAAAILLLSEEGKLSLDDRVVRWLPGLTKAKDITIRQLLSMTAGYSDYWPQDYVMPAMLKPVTAVAILDGWAKNPLDFEPGTKSQYSNTNYVVAGLIAEKAAGQPLFDFLKSRVDRKSVV